MITKIQIINIIVDYQLKILQQNKINDYYHFLIVTQVI